MVPTEATLVVVVAGINAVGQTLGDAVHRPAQGTVLTGLGEYDLLRPQDIATVLGHSDGGLKGIPERARVVVALTRVDAETADAAAEIKDRLAGNTRFERVVVIPPPL